ncbi:MAG: DUF4384 domain-containing protein [Gammaproteobacteria bacterium]|nr:DUF4384 domain-containing protein [Gammaproteobacteria bacterium]
MVCNVATAAEPLYVNITTHLGDRQEFQAGDRVQFLLDLSQDAYILLIYQDARGALTQMIPNRTDRSGFFKAARYLGIPDARTPFEFVVGPPFGTEIVWVYAASQPFPELEGAVLDNGLKRLIPSHDGLIAALQSHAGKKDFQYVAASVQLRTHPSK